MKWPHKYKNAPKEGTTRKRRSFLWIPRLDESDDWRWLEHAEIEEEWCQTYFYYDTIHLANNDFRWRIKRVFGSDVAANEPKGEK